MSDDGDLQQPPRDGKEAQRQSMWKLRGAVLKRREHAEHAASWRRVDSRNHFGPSIETAMRIGRNNNGQ